MIERRVPRGPLLPPQGHRARPCRRFASGRDEIPRSPTSSSRATRGSTTGRCGRSPTSCAQLFLQYRWPGNIRELENMIKRVVILQDEQLVDSRNRTQYAARGGAPRPQRRAVAACRRGVSRSAPAVGMRRGLGALRAASLRAPTRRRRAGRRREPSSRRRRRRIARGRGEGGVDESRAGRHRAHARVRCTGTGARLRRSSA